MNNGSYKTDEQQREDLSRKLEAIKRLLIAGGYEKGEHLFDMVEEAQALATQQPKPMMRPYKENGIGFESALAAFTAVKGKTFDSGVQYDNFCGNIVDEHMDEVIQALKREIDDFTILLITNAYEKGVGCGMGHTDQGKDLREMYRAGSIEQRAYIMGWDEGVLKRGED